MNAGEAAVERSFGRERGLGQRVAELLLVGGVTPVLFALSFVLRRALGLSAADYAVGFTMFYAAFVINDPHFAVTYLLFYEDGRARAFGAAFGKAQRLRWWFAGVVVPLGLFAWGAWALHAMSAPMLGAMMELMFALVGFHYVKQGFGVMVTLSARNGILFSKWERIAILAHAYAGWIYAWANPATDAREVESKGVVYRALAHPAVMDRGARVLFFASFAAMALMLIRKWRASAPLTSTSPPPSTSPLALASPLIGLLASIWAWSVYSSIDPLVVYVVPALHSIQYLYFVWLLKGNQAREREGPPFFERARTTRLTLLALTALALGFLLFHGAPALFDGALVGKHDALRDTGPTPYFAAIYAFVNIHHYFMDFVIWRRDNPISRYLRI